MLQYNRDEKDGGPISIDFTPPFARISMVSCRLLLLLLVLLVPLLLLLLLLQLMLVRRSR